MKALRTVMTLAFVLGVAVPTLTAQQEAAVQEQGPRQIEVTVLGMSCPFCAYGLERKLKKLEGVEELEVVLETGVATLRLTEQADISNELLQEAVKEAGFEVAKIVRSFESEYPDFEKPKK